MSVQEVLEVVREMSVEERAELIRKLEHEFSEDAANKPTARRDRERAWVDAHRDEYIGQWIALEGDRLITHGKDSRAVYLAAREAGIEVPFMAHVDPVEEPSMGGW